MGTVAVTCRTNAEPQGAREALLLLLPLLLLLLLFLLLLELIECLAITTSELKLHRNDCYRKVSGSFSTVHSR